MLLANSVITDMHHGLYHRVEQHASFGLDLMDLGCKELM